MAESKDKNVTVLLRLDVVTTKETEGLKNEDYKKTKTRQTINLFCYLCPTRAAKNSKHANIKCKFNS